MGFDDFMYKFDTIGLSRVTNWDELRLRGKFIRYSDVKEPENEIVVSKWYYALEVPEKSHVVIGLHQEDERQEATMQRRPYIDMGVALLKRDIMDGSKFVQHKDF